MELDWEEYVSDENGDGVGWENGKIGMEEESGDKAEIEEMGWRGEWCGRGVL